MRKNILLAVGITILFLGLAVQPSIATVQPEEEIDVEYVEIATEVCGLPSKNHTVQLTTEEALEIKGLFDSIRERLNETETGEEAEEIFKETVIDLHNYDLLGDLSVKQAQRLVTRGYKNPRIMKLLEKIYSGPEENPDEIENMFCLLIGDTNWNIGSQGPLARIGYKITIAVYDLLNSTPLFELLEYPEYLYENGRIGRILYNLLTSILFPIEFITSITLILMILMLFYYYLNCMIYESIPINIGTIVGFGINYSTEDGFDFRPAEGWIKTYGINGNKNWNGEFYGRLTMDPITLMLLFGGVLYYPGASGFTGIKLSYHSMDTDDYRYFLIGSAYKFKIGSEPI